MGRELFHFLWAFTWNVTLLVAFLGWGRLAEKLLSRLASSLAISTCIGLSVAICFGGILNLFQLIVLPLLISFVLAGVGLVVWQAIERKTAPPSLEMEALGRAWRQRWPMKPMVFLCFILFFVFRAASTPCVFKYMPQDDPDFYLVMPVKMMETHHLAADPFSERRIESSLGGSYFLQCMEMSALPLKNVQMADHFVGFILIVLFALALARRFELSPLATMILAIFAIGLIPVEFNLTYSVLPSALWLAMILITAQPAPSDKHRGISALLVGLVAGALCTLKSTFLPFAVLYCACLYPLLGWGRGWKGTLILGACTFLGASMVMLPWMIAMRATSGTWLYPVLGSGYDFSAYRQYPMPFTADPHQVVRRGFALYAPLVLIIMAQLFILKRKGACVFLAATVVCLVSGLSTGFATGDGDNRRYIFPIVLPTLLLAYIQFAWERRRRPGWRLGSFLWALIIAVEIGGIVILARYGQYGNMWHSIESGLTDRAMDSEETRQEYDKIAVALPTDGSILESLQNPYLLDFSSRRIFLADCLGCAGPPPGWPVNGDGEAVATYLLNHSIRYVAYTYVGNASLDASTAQKHRFHLMSVRGQVQFGMYQTGNNQYLQLRQSRRTLYDDGKTFIIDLATKVARIPD